MSQAEFKKRLKALMIKTENHICSDCPERQPRWASLIVPPPGSPPGSLAMGALCCLECSGSHRRLGVHISFVRSITLDSWKEKEVRAMENGGNAKVNAIFEATLQNRAAKPTAGASGPVRERFIRDKYERRKYYDPSVLQNYTSSAPAQASSASAPAPAATNRRVPSEAARLRAQARKSSSRPGATSISNSRSMPVTAAAPPATVEDLLDFNAPISDSGSLPNPPSAAPSPTIDMFKNMNMGMGGGTNNNASFNGGGIARSQTVPVHSNNLAPQTQNISKKMTSDDILAMFHTPSPPQQQFGNFSNFNSNSNNSQMGGNNMQQGQSTMSGNGGNQMMNNMGSGSQMGQFGGNNGTNTMNHQNRNMSNQQNTFRGMQQSNSVQNNMMGGSGGQMSRGMQQQQQQSNNMQHNMMGGNVNSGMNNNMMQQQQQPMGGAPSNLNTMGGNGMSHQYNNMSGTSMNSNQNGMGMGSRNGNNDNAMGGTANTQQQFTSFGNFR